MKPEHLVLAYAAHWVGIVFLYLFALVLSAFGLWWMNCFVLVGFALLVSSLTSMWGQVQKLRNDSVNTPKSGEKAS